MSRKKTVTMQEIADAVGTSIATVSRVLGNSNPVRNDMRDRVVKTAARLGYLQIPKKVSPRPNYLLNDKHTQAVDLKHIMLLVSERVLHSMEGRENWIYSGIVPNLHRLAGKKGFHLTLSSYGQNDQWNPAALKTQNVDGILWLGYERMDLLADISKTVPVVMLNGDYAWPPRTSVLADNRMVIFKAVEHLIDLGHSRIGCFAAGRLSSWHNRERLAAYMEAVDYFHLPSDLAILEPYGKDPSPEKTLLRATDRLLAMDKEKRPTAVIIFSLRYAIRLLEEFQKRSVSVPKDLSIVAVDNAIPAEMTNPPLTVVDCMFGYCAEVAVDLLLEMKGTPPERSQILLQEPELIIRKSTAPPSVK